MRIPEKGCSTEEVFARLDGFREQDLPTDNGRAFGYIYDAGEEVAAIQKRAVGAFLSKNGLDPTAFPSLKLLENEVVGMSLAHLNAPEGAVGTFTSGGTESCMLAVKAARDWARSEKGIAEPQILVPTTAHAAFHKGAKYFDVELVPVAVDPKTFRADVADARSKVTERTAMIVGSSPGYAHGVIDPISELAALAQEKGLLMHVDGCIGAWLLPYFERLGEDIETFDFRIEGVTSISMDLHKYAYAPKGSSVLLWRNLELRRHQLFACAGWTGYSVVNTTMQSTKSGGPLAGAWAVMQHLGDEGYLDLAKRILDGTKTLLEGLRAIDGLEVLGDPKMGLIAIASDEINVFQLADLLQEKQWYTQPQLAFGGSPRNLHLLVEPSNAAHAEAFLEDLEDAVEDARDRPVAAPPKPLLQMAQALTPEMLRKNFDMLLGAVGAGGEDASLPKDRALMNQIIDALNPETKEAMLIEFLGRMYRP